VGTAYTLIAWCRVQSRIGSNFTCRFMDGEVSWVSALVNVFSPNDISRLRRPKSVKFGTKVASSMRMLLALRFMGKVS